MCEIEYVIISSLLIADLLLHLWGLVRLDQIREKIEEVLRWM